MSQWYSKPRILAMDTFQSATTYRKLNFCSKPETDDDSNIPLNSFDKGNRVVLSTTIKSANYEIDHHLQHNKNASTSRTSHTIKNEDDKLTPRMDLN